MCDFTPNIKKNYYGIDLQPTKCTWVSSQEEEILFYREKWGSLLFSFSNEYIVPIFPKRIKNMECKYREYSTDEGRIEYRCNGGKNDKKMCEESNDDHHVCEWCKLKIAMENFTITRRPRASSPLLADQIDNA